MIQPGNHYLVFRPQLPRKRPADMECQACHVVAKNNLIPVAAEQIGDRLMRRLDHRVCTLAGLKQAVRVRVAARHVVDHGRNDALVYLRTAGIVEKNSTPAVELFMQRRELLSNLCHIQHCSLLARPLSRASGPFICSSANRRPASRRAPVPAKWKRHPAQPPAAPLSVRQGCPRPQPAPGCFPK